MDAHQQHDGAVIPKRSAFSSSGHPKSIDEEQEGLPQVQAHNYTQEEERNKTAELEKPNDFEEAS